MTPTQLREARAALGALWGLDRPLRASELGRALGLNGRDPGRHILDCESGKHEISGPISTAVEMMLDGARPRRLEETLHRKSRE